MYENIGPRYGGGSARRFPVASRSGVSAPSFFPQTPTGIQPRHTPSPTFRPQTPTRMFEPQTPTPITSPFEQQTPSPIFEQQTPTPIDTPFEPRVPTPIDSPFEPQTPTPIETEAPTDSWRDYVYNHPGVEHQKRSPLDLNRVKLPSLGWLQFGTPMFDMALKKNVRPGVTAIEWLREVYGDDYAWQIIEKGARNPQQWLKHFEQPNPQTPEPRRF